MKGRQCSVASLPAFGSHSDGPACRLLWAKPVEEKIFQKPSRVLEAAVAAAIRPEHGAYLDIEVGIMLRRRPDREDQVIRVGPRDLAVAHPALHDLRLLVDEA